MAEGQPRRFTANYFQMATLLHEHFKLPIIVRPYNDLKCCSNKRSIMTLYELKSWVKSSKAIYKSGQAA